MSIVEEDVSLAYAAPGQPGAVANYRPQYGHYIGGEFVAPVKGQYFENISPVNGKPFTEVGRGTAEDIDRAVEVAWKAFASWGKTSPAERSVILNRIADRIEQHLEEIAVAETWENGKPVRETLAGTSRSPSTTSATSPGCSARRRAASASWMRTPWRITSTSRSVWSARSSRGTSRS